MDTIGIDNVGWKARRSFVKKSKIFETIGRPPVFPFTCAGKYYPPGFTYRFELTCNDDDFLLLCPENKDVKIIVRDIHSMIYHVCVDEQIASLAHEQFM